MVGWGAAAGGRRKDTKCVCEETTMNICGRRSKCSSSQLLLANDLGGGITATNNRPGGHQPL